MKTINKMLLATIASSIVTFNVFAAVPNTFTSGTAAIASEVNENFTSLDARITAIEAALNTTPTYQELLADNTYSGQFIFFGYLGASDGNNGFGAGGNNNPNDENPTVMRFMKGGGSISITLNADGSVSNDIGSEIEVDSLLTAACANYDQAGDCTQFSSDVQTFEDSWNDVASSTLWEVDESTGIVTITWDGNATDKDAFQVSEDGSVMYSLSFINEIDGDRQMENAVIIMTRQK